MISELSAEIFPGEDSIEVAVSLACHRDMAALEAAARILNQSEAGVEDMKALREATAKVVRRISQAYDGESTRTPIPAPDQHLATVASQFFGRRADQLGEALKVTNGEELKVTHSYMRPGERITLEEFALRMGHDLARIGILSWAEVQGRDRHYQTFGFTPEPNPKWGREPRLIHGRHLYTEVAEEILVRVVFEAIEVARKTKAKGKAAKS